MLLRLWVFFILNLALVTAQDFSFTATVLDEHELPLSYATVALSDSLKTTRYATKDDGTARFPISLNRSYRAVVSRSGRVPVSWEFVAKGDTQQTFILLPKDQVDLDSLVITIDNAIVYKKDTTIYKLEAFTNKSERRLKDALVKLPGIELEDGRLTFNGKNVSKITVEDKEFFGNNKRIALEKLPAGAVEKVEAIENYNESSIRAGTKSDGVVLNLDLKGNKKNVIFGDLNAGLGIENRYENEANLFYFGSTSLNLIADSNNTGAPALTFRDLIEIYGGVTQFLNLSSPEDSFREIYNSPLAQFASNANDFARQENFVGVNMNHEFNANWRVDFFAMANDVNVLQKNNQDIQYLTNNEVFATDSRATQNNLDQQNAIAKLKITYTPNSKTEVFGNALFSYIHAVPIRRTIQFFGDSENNLQTIDRSTNWKAQANAELHRKYSTKHRGFFGWEGIWDRKDTETRYESDRNLFPNELDIVASDVFRLRQNQFPSSLSSSLSYQHIYDQTARKRWTFDAEVNRNHHQLQTDLSQILPGENRGLGAINDSEFRRSQAFLGLTYSYTWRRMLFDFGAKFWHIATLQDFAADQRTRNLTDNFLAPYFRFTFDFRTSEKLQLSYNFAPETINFSLLLQAPILQSFSTVRIGNPNLSNERFHNVQLYYNKTVKFYDFSLNNTFNYRTAEKGLLYFTQQQGFTAAQSLALFENPNSEWSNRLNVSKGVFKVFTLKLRQVTRQSRSERFFNGELIQNRSQGYETSIKTQYEPTKSVSLSYDVRYSQNIFRSEQQRNTARTWRNAWEADVQFLKFYNLKSDFVLTQLRDVRGQQNSFSDANLEISHFHQEKKLSFSVRLQNVFNNASRVNNTLDEQILQRREQFLQERLLLFKVAWNF